MSACLKTDAPAVMGNVYLRDDRISRNMAPSFRADYRMVPRQLPFRRDDPVGVAFESLADTWRRETSILSSLNDIFDHPAYVKIVRLGPAVVPYIIAALKLQPELWFDALAQITGQDPVAEDDLGCVRAMADAWIGWAARQEENVWLGG